MVGQRARWSVDTDLTHSYALTSTPDAKDLMAPPVTKEMAAKVATTKNPWAAEATMKDIELLKLEKQRREEEG